MRVREGDSVNAGQILAVLDDQQVRAREEPARGAVEGAEARAKAAKAQIDVLEEQLRQSQLQTEQATVDAEGRVSQAEADVAAAESDLARQEASFQLRMGIHTGPVYRVADINANRNVAGGGINIAQPGPRQELGVIFRDRRRNRTHVNDQRPVAAGIRDPLRKKDIGND